MKSAWREFIAKECLQLFRYTNLFILPTLVNADEILLKVYIRNGQLLVKFHSTTFMIYMIRTKDLIVCKIISEGNHFQQRLFRVMSVWEDFSLFEDLLRTASQTNMCNHNFIWMIWSLLFSDLYLQLRKKLNQNWLVSTIFSFNSSLSLCKLSQLRLYIVLYWQRIVFIMVLFGCFCHSPNYALLSIIHTKIS